MTLWHIRYSYSCYGGHMQECFDIKQVQDSAIDNGELVDLIFEVIWPWVNKMLTHRAEATICSLS